MQGDYSIIVRHTGGPMGDDDVTEAPVVLDGVTLQWDPEAPSRGAPHTGRVKVR